MSLPTYASRMVPQKEAITPAIMARCDNGEQFAMSLQPPIVNLNASSYRPVPDLTPAPKVLVKKENNPPYTLKVSSPVL